MVFITATWVPIMQIIEDAEFGFSSPYWTNDNLLNDNSSPEDHVNAKYSSFLNEPFYKIRMCVGKMADNCIYHRFSRFWKNAKELFSSGMIQRTQTKDLTKDKMVQVYRPENGSYRVS